MTRQRISIIIKYLRRFLLLGFMTLSLVLCHQQFAGSKAKKKASQEKEPELSLNKAEWGTAVERLARETDLPIFFSVKDTFREEAASSSLIKKHFIYTELDPELYPAEFLALKALHSNAKDDARITCGVLTSKMYPLLTSTSTNFNGNEAFPSIRSTLWGIINLYHENYNKFLKISQNFYLLNDIPSKYHMKELKEDISKLTFMLDFGLHKNFKAAQLSESARLTFRNCTVSNYSPYMTKMKIAAHDELLEKIEDDSELNFIERAFYTRALADYILIFDDFKDVDLLKEFATEIISWQDSDGAFVIDGAKDSLKNALAITILSYTYKITKEEKFLKATSDFANFMIKTLSEEHGLSADFEKGGIAGAKGYVYLSRALLNAFLVSYDRKYLGLTRQILQRLNKHSKKLNSMVLELSDDSTLSKYINLCSVEDDSYTSTNGVLLQTYKDMATLKLMKDLDGKIKEILDSTLDSDYKDIDFDFSLRIAKYPNPLISLNTLKKLELIDKNKAIKDK